MNENKLIEAAEQYACGLREIDEKNVYDNIEVDSARITAFKNGARWQSNQMFTEALPPMDTPVVLIYGDGGEDDCDIGHYTGLNYVNKMGQQVGEHVIGWIPIPKFNA